MDLFTKFWNDRSGQFAIITAIMAVPILICVAIAIETSTKIRKTRALQSALDSAALAAVIPGNITIQDREEFAEQVFIENLKSMQGVEVEATATDSRVDIEAHVIQKNLFIDVLKQGEAMVSGKASAVRTVEDVICVMTLDKSSSGSLNFEKDAIFKAEDCSVQVNSDNRHALTSLGNYIPQAQSICVVGGIRGQVPQDVKTGCSPVADPYEHIRMQSSPGCDFGPVSLFSFGSFQDIMTVGEEDAVRKPGVYCGGLHIYDSTVHFEPGTYIIKDGPFSIGHNSKVTGEGVTFVFTGLQSVLYMYENVEMDFTAPNSGTYAGLIFFQDRTSSRGETSIIKGGVDIRLVGTIYFPTQNLYVGGHGTMGSSSPALAFIANNVTFTSDIERVITANEAYMQEAKVMLEYLLGAAYSLGLSSYRPSAVTARTSTTTEFTTSIRTNGSSHEAAGLPPVLPRADAGARLIMSE